MGLLGTGRPIVHHTHANRSWMRKSDMPSERASRRSGGWWMGGAHKRTEGICRSRSDNLDLREDRCRNIIMSGLVESQPRPPRFAGIFDDIWMTTTCHGGNSCKYSINVVPTLPKAERGNQIDRARCGGVHGFSMSPKWVGRPTVSPLRTSSISQCSLSRAVSHVSHTKVDEPWGSLFNVGAFARSAHVAYGARPAQCALTFPTRLDDSPSKQDKWWFQERRRGCRYESPFLE
jgi:hypothetical protein